MKKRKIYVIRYSCLVIFLLFILAARLSPQVGEWYATRIYPWISAFLSAFSSFLFPFSLGDLFIFLSILGVLLYALYARYKKLPWKKTLRREAEFFLWIYVWFYMAWGLNYFRQDFYMRASVPEVNYTPEVFYSFLNKYIGGLNASYVPAVCLDKKSVAREMYEKYSRLDERFGLARPREYQKAKTMLFTPLISKVGILGYMGPFFSEFHLNGDLPASQYPATYAHEMAHLLGVSSEAEANFYSFLLCSSSDHPQIRFSGYLSLLPHVAICARNLLVEEEYNRIIEKIRPEVLEVYKKNRLYWEAKKSPLADRLQGFVYNWFLKGNNIPDGTKNYSGVIDLLIAYNLS